MVAKSSPSDAPRPGLAAALTAPRFEVIPSPAVVERSDRLPAGAKVTVTCSPTWGIERTLEVGERLASKGFDVVPHVSARLVRDDEHLRRIADRLATAGMREAFVVGGDSKEPAGRFGSATQLLETLAAIPHDIRSIGVACYPDGHPLVAAGELHAALVAKAEWASYAVTQMCLDPSAIARWLTSERRDGMSLPVHLGVPGVVDRRKLLEISLRIGVGQSARYLKKNRGVIASLLGRRRYRPDALLKQLAPHFDEPVAGLAGVHVNTFNQVDATVAWRDVWLRRLPGRGEVAGGESCVSPVVEQQG